MAAKGRRRDLLEDRPGGRHLQHPTGRKRAEIDISPLRQSYSLRLNGTWNRTAVPNTEYMVRIGSCKVRQQYTVRNDSSTLVCPRGTITGLMMIRLFPRSLTNRTFSPWRDSAVVTSEMNAIKLCSAIKPNELALGRLCLIGCFLLERPVCTARVAVYDI